jgi:methyl-accepting chemotaxis protein
MFVRCRGIGTDVPSVNEIAPGRRATCDGGGSTAEQTNARIADCRCADRIGEVVKLISAVAAQTNLRP